jgi:hypothetical protein
MRKENSSVHTGTIICQRCNLVTPRRGPVQKYCEKCSQIMDAERKAKWAKTNPLIRTAEQNKALNEKKESKNKERGSVNNKPTVENISVFPDISDTVSPFISFISDILQKNLEKVNYFSHFLLTKCEYWFTLISRVGNHPCRPGVHGSPKVLWIRTTFSQYFW